MDAGLKYIEELERSLPAGSKPLVMHAFQAAMEVASEYTQFSTEERVQNGEMFRLTLLAMRQYLELYALLSGPRGGGVVKPIAITFYEFEQAIPLLRKWGVRVGDVQRTFERIDVKQAGVVKFDDFARWVMRAQMESLASGLMLRNRTAQPPSPPSHSPGGLREKELNSLPLSLGADGKPTSDWRSRYGSRSRSPSPTKRSPTKKSPKPHDDSKTKAKDKAKSTGIPVRPRSSKYDLAERLSDVGLQQYARRLKQLGFDDVRQLLALQFSVDHRDSNRLDPSEASFATLLDNLNLMPGHRVRMIHFFQNSARQATQQAHESMLDAANARAKDVLAAEKRNEEELELVKMRLSELQEEVTRAQEGEALAKQMTKQAWESSSKVHEHARQMISRSTGRVVMWRDQKMLGAVYVRIAQPVFDEWRDLGRGRRKAKRFLRRLTNRGIARAFSQWVDVVDSLARLKQIMYRWKQRELAKGFDTWYNSNEKSTKAGEVESTMHKFVRRLRNRSLAYGWEAWHSWWEDKRKKRDRVRNVAARFKNPGVAKAFFRWYEAADARGTNIRRARRVLQRHFQSGVSKAWNTWVAYLEPFRIVKRAAKALYNQGIRRAFNSWVEGTKGSGEMQRQRELMRNFAGRLANIDLARGWSSWREFINARAEKWALLEKVSVRWRMTGASMAFATWAAVAQERTRKTQLMMSFAGRLANMEVARAWASWVEICDERAKMRHAMMGIIHPLLRKTYLAWVRFHYMQHESLLWRFGRKLWYYEHMVAQMLWQVEQRTEHALHLDRRARRQAARAERKRVLLAPGEKDADESDGSDEDDNYVRERRQMSRGQKSSKIEPLYSEYDLPATDGPFASRVMKSHDGGYLSEQGYLSYRSGANEATAAATGYMRIERHQGGGAGALEPPSYVRRQASSTGASASVESRLRQDRLLL